MIAPDERAGVAGLDAAKATIQRLSDWCAESFPYCCTGAKTVTGNRVDCECGAALVIQPTKELST